jgi:hypothetical protein
MVSRVLKPKFHSLGLYKIAAFGGIFFGWDSRIVGGLALIPGITALIASTMRFQGKSNWHYRYRDDLEALKSRLLYELPESPLVNHIAEISEAKRTLTGQMQMQKRFEDSFSMDWTNFLPSRH